MLSLGLGVGALQRTKRVGQTYPSAFFNGMDTTGKTSYTGGPTYVPDHLGVLRSPGANLPACQGFRLDGTTYINTDESGNAILASTPQKTVTYNTDWTAKTFAETFDKFDISDPLTAPGWLCEPARTNYCLYNNELSNAAWVKTNTTAEISGASPVAGLNAWKVSAIAAAASEFRADFAMPAGAVTASVYMKKGSAPTALSKLQLRNQSTSTTISLVVVNLDTGAFAYPAGATGCNVTAVSDGWFRVDLSVSIASAATIRMSVGANGNHETAGSYVYLCAHQLEVGAFPTSPIPTTTATATRAGTVLTYPTAGKIRSNNMAMRKLIIPKATGQSGVYAYGTYLDANNYTALLISPTSLTLRKRVAGVDTDATVNVTHASGVPLDIIGIRSATFGMKIAVRSYSAGTWSAWTDGAAVTTAAAKANAIIGTTYQLGALNSVAQFTGNISLFDTLLLPDGIADPLAWAKSQWRIA